MREELGQLPGPGAERRELFSGTLLYAFSEVLNRALPFLLLPLLTIYLSPADFGVVGLLTAFGTLLVPVFSLGIGAAIAPFYFERSTDEHKGAVVGTASGMLVGSTAAMMALVFAFAPLISTLSFETATLSPLVLLTSFGTGTLILTTPFRQYALFERLARSYVILTTTCTLLTVLVTLAEVVWLERGARGVIEATVVGQAFTCIVFAVFALRRTRPTFSRDRAMQMLKLGLPLIPAFGSLFLLQHGTKYLLQQTRGIADVGVYTLGVNVGLSISVLVTAFQSAWVPFFMSYADRPEDARDELGRITTYYIFSFGALSLALFLVARPVVMLLTEPAYHDAWRVVGISGTTQLLNGLFIVLLPGVYFAKEVKLILLPQSVAAVVSLSSAVPLIRGYGIFGASLAMLAGYAALVALQFWLNRARGYVAVRYQWRRLGWFGASYLFVSIAALASRNWSLSRESAVAVGGLLVLGLLMWTHLTRLERQDLVAWVRRMIHKRPQTGDLSTAG